MFQSLERMFQSLERTFHDFEHTFQTLEYKTLRRRFGLYTNEETPKSLFVLKYYIV